MPIRIVILLSLFALAMSPVYAAGPCQCEDVQKLRDHLARVTKSEAAWMQIFGWARGLRRIGKPKSNDEMNGKFSELMNTPPANWEDAMGKPAEPKSLSKIAGLNEDGEVIIDEGFVQANCKEIVEAERVHERMHKEFYLRVGNVLRAYSEERLFELRAESEVESYRAQKEYLRTTLDALERKCRIVLRISHRIQHDPQSPSSLGGWAQFDGAVQFDVSLEYFAVNYFRGEVSVNRPVVVRHVTSRCSGSGRQVERWVVTAMVDPAADSMEVQLGWSASNKSASWSCGPLVYVDLYGLKWSLRMSTKAETERAIGGKGIKTLESLIVRVMQGRLP